MAQSPQSNLPPLAQPWGRYIEKSITDIKETTRLAELNNKNNLKQLNSSVSLLSRQQNTLEDTQDTLIAQQATLSAQQTTLTNQQNTLAAQQTTLTNQQNTLAAQQVQLTATDNYLATLSASTASTVGSETVVYGPNAWYGGTLPSVTVSTSTGKLLVFVSGYVYSSSFGAALTFSIPGYVSRTTQIQDLISGGGGGRLNGLISYAQKSQTGTYTQLVTGLPINTPLTVKMEMYVYNNGSFTSPAIIAQVVA